MYITTVLSFLGAWQKLQNEHPAFLEGLQRVLATITPEEVHRIQQESPTNSSRRESLLAALDYTLKMHLAEQGWRVEEAIRSSTGQKWREIDAISQGVGVEFHFSDYLRLLSDLFVKYPIFLRANQFQIPVIVVPTSEELCGVRFLGRLRRTHKDIHDMFIDIGDPLPLKYPFAIFGVSDVDIPLHVEELTSQMDQFLIMSVGLSLNEMRLLTEQPQFDFKEQFPDGRDFAELAAALANLRGGGVVLIGVDNQGNITGLPRGQFLDNLLLRITNVIQDTCQPRPHFSLHIFDDPSDANRCVVVVYIREIEYKPCMVRGRVYVRVGSSTRIAGPDELRRLVLG